MMWMASLTLQMKIHLQTSALVNELWCGVKRTLDASGEIQVSSNACYCSCIYLIIKSFKRFIYPVSISVVAPPGFEPV